MFISCRYFHYKNILDSFIHLSNVQLLNIQSFTNLNISASIVSKKAAENISALVLDVKIGSGGFCKEENEALELAKSMVSFASHYVR